MYRRDFLKLLSVVMMGFTTTACAGKEGATKKKIIVVGAGIAGLAAARELQHRGHEVVIVEARDRIGGRIQTSNQWPDMPIDLGATWVHGVMDNPLTDLAEEMQATRLVTSYDKTISYSTNGQPTSAAEEERIDELRMKIYEALEKAQAKDVDSSIQQAIAPLLSQYDESSEAYRFINFIISSEIEQEHAGSAETLSAKWYDNAEEFEGGDALFAKGFSVITAFLADSLQIQLGQVVKEIQWGQSPVNVITQKTEFSADHVIVTLPLGVLQAKSVRFSPELPDKKQEAIVKLGMGVLNKCYLRFDNAFWPADVDWLEYISAKEGEWTEWVSFKQEAGKPVLLGFNAADRAKEMEAWTDEQIVQSAMATLKTIYGADTPEPVDYQITRWATDPFSLGSYSYHAVGSTPEMRKVLSESLNQKVFFAGEASDVNNFGTAHGAYFSGMRVAGEIEAAHPDEEVA